MRHLTSIKLVGRHALRGQQIEEKAHLLARCLLSNWAGVVLPLSGNAQQHRNSTMGDAQ